MDSSNEGRTGFIMMDKFASTDPASQHSEKLRRCAELPGTSVLLEAEGNSTELPARGLGWRRTELIR